MTVTTLAGGVEAQLWGSSARVSATDREESALTGELMGLVAGTRAASTWKAYEPAFGKFARWCAERVPPRCPLPAEPFTVALYLTHVGRTAKSYSVVKTASGAIHSAHEVAGHLSPTGHHTVAMARKGLERKIGRAPVNRKDPLPFGVLRGMAVEVLATGPRQPDHLLKRFALVTLLLDFAGLLRYSDLAGLKADAVAFYPDRAELHLETRKNDQVREGGLVVLKRGTSSACPVRHLEWLFGCLPDLTARRHVPVFQKYDGWKVRRDPGCLFTTMTGEPITYEQLQKLQLSQLSKAMGVPEPELKKRFGTHSLRSGGTTEVADKALTEPEKRALQCHGGWKDPATMEKYVQRSLSAKLSATAAMDY